MNKEVEKKIYDDLYKGYDEWYNNGCLHKYFRYLLLKVLGYADKESIKNVLDVGCGQGTTIFTLSSYLKEASFLGIDFSKEGIQACQKKYSNIENIKFVEGDVIDNSINSMGGGMI